MHEANSRAFARALSGETFDRWHPIDWCGMMGIYEASRS
jgi:hypothetical protein